jgi:HAD superfamily 5'-nucleotidase-like hydrolase
MLATATVKEDISSQQHFSESLLKHTEIRSLKRDMSRSIFCNVELNCANVEAVGFDMDFTLAQYNEDFDLLAFEGAKRKLVDVLHYPNEVLDFEYNPDLIRRGLIIDKRRGNIVKIDRHKYVRRGFHGMQELADRRVYNQQAVSFSGNSFAHIDTMFLVIDAILFMYMVDLRDRFPEKMLHRSYEQIYADIRKAVDLCHRDGVIKNSVMKQPDKYILQDPDLVPMLQQLKAAGKKVFLLTNSLWDYTNVVMNYLVQASLPGNKASWQDLFDVITVGGNKPAFLQQDYLSLFTVDTETGNIRNIEDRESVYPSAQTHSLSPKVFQGGCWLDLHRLLRVPSGDRVLYVGDHMYADILRSKRTLGWRTCLIIPELENELRVAQDAQDMHAEILQWRKQQYAMDDALDHLRARILSLQMSSDDSQSKILLTKMEQDLQAAVIKSEEMKHRLKTLSETYNRRFNPYWGQFLKAGHQHSRFAKQTMDYACLYTSRASNLRFVSPQRAFRPVQDFHPADTILHDEVYGYPPSKVDYSIE